MSSMIELHKVGQEVEAVGLLPENTHILDRILCPLKEQRVHRFHVICNFRKANCLSIVVFLGHQRSTKEPIKFSMKKKKKSVKTCQNFVASSLEILSPLTSLRGANTSNCMQAASSASSSLPNIISQEHQQCSKKKGTSTGMNANKQTYQTSE